MKHPEIQNGTYRTQPQRVSWFARYFPGVAFYSQLARVVWRSSGLAKRGKYDAKAWSDSSWVVIRALEKVGVEFEITGLENVENLDSACLLVGNHMSTLETTVMPGLVQPIREVTFVVKQSLLDYPVFRHVMRSRDPIAVTQTDPRQDFKAMMAGGVERLKKGISLIVFPQGQRTPTFDPEEFNSIGVKLAKKADVPIVPVALLSDAWGIGSVISDVGKITPAWKVHFAFGEPIEVQGRGSEEQEQIVSFIETHLEKWKAEREHGDCQAEGC